jgi:hypothetical protein
MPLLITRPSGIKTNKRGGKYFRPGAWHCLPRLSLYTACFQSRMTCSPSRTTYFCSRSTCLRRRTFLYVLKRRYGGEICGGFPQSQQRREKTLNFKFSYLTPFSTAIIMEAENVFHILVFDDKFVPIFGDQYETLDAARREFLEKFGDWLEKILKNANIRTAANKKILLTCRFFVDIIKGL